MSIQGLNIEMFTAALLIIAPKWNKCKHPFPGKWEKNIVYPNNGFYSAIISAVAYLK